jgi:lipopolysaccharide/colanic/teichoic acid biosynthesis glycosyltransferase
MSSARSATVENDSIAFETVKPLDSSVSESSIRLPRFYMQAKRLFDIVIVLATLPVIAVILIITAIVIKLESDGPIFFWQERIGANGKRFSMLKFRSMKTGSGDTAQFAGVDDDRITRVGRIIRKLRIDELPQIWNVLRGEMSLIGPRPEQIEFVERFQKRIPNYHYRHVVRPGITGLAQTTQGYVADEEGTELKLKYDLYYVKNLSLSLDAMIFFKTIHTILTGFGAR